MNTSPSKIFFLGTPAIATPSLTALNNDPNVEIVGVGVFPDKPVGRKRVLTPCSVKVTAQELNLPIFEIANKDQLVAITNQINFDLGIVIAFGMIFPANLLPLTRGDTEGFNDQNPLNPPFQGGRKEFINVHFSLLPQWRGASPVQAAILNGQTQTGITWQLMAPELDAGDVFMQTKVNITGLNTDQVWKKCAEITAESFPKFIHHYRTGSLTRTPQNDSKATYCSKFSKTDGLVSPTTDTAEEIYRKFLAFTPWPGIYLETTHGHLKILDCYIVDNPFRKNTDGVLLECADGSALFVTMAQLAGKKAMKVKDIMNGHPDLLVLSE